MVNFLKKITDANFLPGKRARGNNHYVYSSIFNSLMDKLIPIVTDEKEVTVEKLKFEETDDVTVSGGSAFITKRSGIITTESLTAAAGAEDGFRIILRDINDNTITLSESAICVVQFETYTGSGLPILYRVNTDDIGNRFYVTVKNIHSSDPLNSAIRFQYFIINV